MKHNFLTFILSLCSLVMLPTTAAAQVDTVATDSYHDTYYRYVSQYGFGAINTESFASSLKLITALSPDTTIRQFVDDYIEEQLTNDMIAAFEPAYRENMSEKSMLTIMAWADEHPGFVELYKKNADITESEESRLIFTGMMLDLYRIKQGFPVDKPSINKKINRNYRKAFNSFWKHCYNYSTLLADNSDEDDKKIISDYIDNTLSIRMMNMYFDNGFTESDLVLLTQHNTLPEQDEVRAVIAHLANDNEYAYKVFTDEFRNYCKTHLNPNNTSTSDSLLQDDEDPSQDLNP